MKRVYKIAKNANYHENGWEEQNLYFDVGDEFYTIEDAINENGFYTEIIDNVITVFDDDNNIVAQYLEIDFIKNDEE